MTKLFGYLRSHAGVHDVLVYAGTFLTLWGADIGPGAGWDSAIAAVPVAASQLYRMYADGRTGAP